MPLFIKILLAAGAESVVSFAGGVLAIFGQDRVRNAAHFVVSFAVGALLGVAFLELLPEAIAMSSVDQALLSALVGIVLFFILEKLLFWYHCHGGVCPVHTYTYLILWGDFLHNFIDGVIIALAFLVDSKLGMFTTLAVVLHEIPQEIGDFGVLVHGGLSHRRALGYNFLVSLSTIAGAAGAYAFGDVLTPILPFALALIAGNFIYLAATDLMPELHESTRLSHSLAQILFIVMGSLLVAIPGYIF